MLASLYKVAREGTLIVGSLVAFLGTPALAVASPVRGAPQPTVHGNPTVSSNPAPSHGGSSTPGASSSSSSSGSSFKEQLLIGAGFAAMWLAGLPIGPGKTVPMSTKERLVRGVGGIGLIAGGVMALVAAFGSGFSLLGFGEAIAGLGMLAFGLHFGLSAVWGKKNDGNLVINHDPGASGANGSGSGTAGNNTGRPGNTAPGTAGTGLSPLIHLPSGIDGLHDVAMGGANSPRSSSTVPRGPVAIPSRVSSDNTNAGVHR